MYKVIFITQKILFPIVIGVFLSSCNSKKENFDIDISNFKPNKTIKKTSASKNISVDLENNLYIKDLISPITKEQILSGTKFGKKDPFSKDDKQINQLSSDLKLTGFINTKINKYVIVSYLNNLGTLTEESVGGLNTNLLPSGAKVVRIDSKNKKLIISFENENYTFEM